MRIRVIRRTASARTGGSILGKLAWTLFATFVLFETIPRFVSVPGLERETLDPPYLASEGKKAFGPHPYLILTPKADYVSEKENKQFSHGPAGFRAPEAPLEKPDGALRIACVGGSSTYCTGPSSDDTTWPALLAGHLAARDDAPPVDVLNAGVPSWTSFECLNALAYRVLPYRPDVVLVYLSTNDAEAALWPDPQPDNSHYRLAWPTFRPSPLESTLEKSITYLAWRKYATDYLEQRADAGFVGKTIPEGEVGETLKAYRMPPMDGPPPEQGFVNFQRNLVSIIAVARAHGATPVLMTQGIFSPAPDSDHLLHGRVRLAAHARMTEIVRAVAAEREVPLVEMKAVLEDAARAQAEAGNEQTIFANNVHLTDEGAALFAEFLASELARLGIV